MTENKEDNIKSLVRSIMIRLIDCDSQLEDWWRKAHREDQKIILEELEDTVYEWLCNDSIKNWIIKDELWLP